MTEGPGQVMTWGKAVDKKWMRSAFGGVGLVSPVNTSRSIGPARGIPDSC